GLSADILFLQEVQGVHRRHAGRYRDWPLKPQHEFIADKVWHEVAYGRNATTRHGHHGNALLSRFPIIAQNNQDISAHAFESRGLLHCVMQLKRGLPPLHCMNVHLGLFERGRRWQINALVELNRFTPGNRLTLLRNGAEYFPALERAIDSARREVWFESYIFADDVSSRRIVAAFARAVKRGVRVRVLVDAWGAKYYLTASLEKEMCDAGVEFLKYRPEVAPWHFRAHRLRRLHRKLCHVDGRL